MTPIEQQLQLLKSKHADASLTPLPSGAKLVTVPGVEIPRGWNQKVVTVLFIAPPGYPAGQPDCFWVEQKALRLENGTTPNGTNDSNPVPEVGARGTWFSWHLQHWNPNTDTLVTYFNVIMQRFQTLQ